MNVLQCLAIRQFTILLICKLVIGHDLNEPMLEHKNGEESSIKEIIQRAPPTSFLLNSGKLRGSASNDIVLMAALKGNGNTLLKEEELEEEQELIREKKQEDEKILEEELETELEKENEEILLEEEEERNPNFISEEERDRLDEEEIEAEREAVLLEERGYPMPVDHQYTGIRRLIHAYVGDDGRLHYEPLSYASGHQTYNYPSNDNHLASLLSRCLPMKFHHLIQQCRDYSTNYHHF